LPRPGVRREWVLKAEQPGLTIALVQAIGTLVLGALVLAAYTARFAPHFDWPDPYITPFFGPGEVSSWILKVSPPYDSRGQRLAHALMCLGAAILFVLPSAFESSEAKSPTRRKALDSIPALIVVIGVVLMASGLKWQAILAGAAFVSGLAWLPFSARDRPTNRIAGALTALLILAVTIPGWSNRLNLSYTADPPTWVEWHYSTVLGSADLLAAGFRLGRDVSIPYGLLPPVLIAAYQRASGHVLAMGDYVLVIKFLQVALLAGCGVLYLKHARGRWAYALLGVALLGPWYHAAQLGLYYPNQTPWRMLCVPVVAAVVMAMRGRPVEAAAAPLGLVSGLALFLNLECGVAATAGIAAYLWQRRSPRSGVLNVLLPASFGMIASFALVFLVHRVALGAWLTPGDLAAMAETVLLVAQWGLSGSPFEVDPLAILMFGHALIVLFVVAWNRRHGPLSAFRAFVAATLVVWFAYYANRPMAWNLSGFHVLYAFLAIDLVRGLAANLSRRRVSGGAVLAVAAVGGILVPSTWLNHASAKPWRGWPADVPAPAIPTTEVSGVLVEKEYGEELRKRAESLRRLAAGRPAVFLSSDAYLTLKLSAVHPALPFFDPLQATSTRAIYDRTLSAIAGSDVRNIYFDALGSRSDRDSPIRGLFQMLRRDIAADYRRVGVDEGWEVWERIRRDRLPLRGPDPTGTEPLRILAVGGRTTEGATSAPGRSWPEQLAADLGRKWPGTWVGNAGREGEDTRVLSQLFTRGGGALDPHVVLIMAGNEDLGVLDPIMQDAALDLRAQAHTGRLGKSHRAEILDWCEKTVVPGYRTRLAEIVRSWRRAGVHPVLLTQPALFGPAIDEATGVDLGTVIVNPDLWISGRLAWQLLELMNRVTRDVGSEIGVPVVDLALGLRKDSRLFDGFLTLSDAGATVMAGHIAQVITPYLKDAGVVKGKERNEASVMRTGPTVLAEYGSAHHIVCGFTGIGHQVVCWARVPSRDRCCSHYCSHRVRDAAGVDLTRDWPPGPGRGETGERAFRD
jgi:hypothetical protein